MEGFMPCPFCGELDEMSLTPIYKHGAEKKGFMQDDISGFYVECHQCTACGPTVESLEEDNITNKKAASDAWNRREVSQ